MSRHWIVRAVAACALLLVLLLTVSCASAPLRDVGENAVDYEIDMNAVENMDMNAAAVDGSIDMNTAAPETLPPAYGTAEPPAPQRDGPDLSTTSPVTVLASEEVRLSPRSAEEMSYTAARPGDATAGEVDDQPFRGLGAFVKPPPWKVGNWYSLEFVVGETQRALSEVAEDRQLAPARTIQMAPVMRVTLDKHPDFDIKPQNPDQEIQELSPERTAAWFWNVRPHKAGRFTLVARVEALQRGPDGQLARGPDGKVRSRVYPPRSVEVEVKVRAIDVINEGTSIGKALGGMFKTWEGTLGALAALIAAAGGVWAAIRKLKGKPVRPRIRRRKKAAQ